VLAAGTVTCIRVNEVTTAAAERLVPPVTNVTVVTPRAKPLPDTVMVLPPLVGPDVVDSELTTGTGS
jgi:hypothetical protein